MDMTKNPPKESMSMLGTCLITIEPHIFEAKLYTIKDLTPVFLKAEATQAPESTSGSPAAFQGAASADLSASSHTPLPPCTTAGTSPQVLLHSTAEAPVQTLVSSQTPVPSQTPVGAQTPVLSQAKISDSWQNPSVTPQPAARPGQDPVIRMLAQRAATSPQLGDLMKIVAGGTANSDQLQIFQSHIDELNAILDRQKLTSQPPPPPAPPAAISVTAQPFLQGYSYNYAQPATGRSQYPSSSMAYPQPHGPYRVPAPPKSRAYIPPKPEIRGVAIEFVGGSSDRFWFPRHSVLEPIPGSRAIRATFVVRKEKHGVHAGGKHKGKASRNLAEMPDVFYQPVTVLISSEKPFVLEQLARGVAPHDEACKHIGDIKASCTRTKSVHLAPRLPQSSPPPEGTSRRNSLLRASLGASPAPLIDPRPPRGGRHKHEDRGPACQYCFMSLAASVTMGTELVCESCAPLIPIHVLREQARDQARAAKGPFGYLRGQATSGRALMMSA